MSDATLAALINEAWRQHGAAAGEPWLVEPSAPVLFFGDLASLRASDTRVMTVALNPSRLEFPADDPFRRFPGIAVPADVASYIGALGGYFHEAPY